MNWAMSAELPDLSKRAIDWAVLSSSLQHPAVIYPAAAGVLGGLGAALLTASPALITGAAIGGGVALVSLGVNCLLRRQHFASSYIEKAHQALIAYRTSVLEHLERDLREAGSREGRSQFERFAEKIKAFEDVLDDKLGKNELTYSRFLGIAQQVYLSGMDKLRQENLGRIAACLAQNEQALAQLDSALAAIAQMKTGSTQASVDMETAMNDLQQIARRARDYSSQQS